MGIPTLIPSSFSSKRGGACSKVRASALRVHAAKNKTWTKTITNKKRKTRTHAPSGRGSSGIAEEFACRRCLTYGGGVGSDAAADAVGGDVAGGGGVARRQTPSPTRPPPRPPP